MAEQSVGLVDDATRRAFPGLSDEQILEVYRGWRERRRQSSKAHVTAWDLTCAKICMYMGYEALKDFLGSGLDPDDFLSVVAACDFLRSVDDVEELTRLRLMSSAEDRKVVSARERLQKTYSQQKLKGFVTEDG